MILFPGLDMPERNATERKRKAEAFAKWAADEKERIRRQRSYLTAMAGRVRDALVQKMLDRAWWLLDANECDAADALLEFVPAAEAEALLNEYFRDDYEPPKPVTRMKRVGDLSEAYTAPPSIQRWSERRLARGRGAR